MGSPSEGTFDLARLRPRASAVLGVLAAILVVHAAHALTHFGSHAVDRAVSDWLYDAFMVACALVCIARGVLVRAERAAWLILGLGIASWAVGEIYWSLFFADDSSPPAPSVADGFYLALYPALYAAIVLLGRSRMRSFQRSMWLDGAIGGLAVASLTSALIFDPVLRSTGGGAASVATNLAYPVGDLLLLGLLTAVLAMTGWRPARALGLMAAALACNGVADAVYLYQVAESSYVDGSILDSAWLLSVLLLAAAAWQPVPARRPADEVTSWRLLAAPAVSALVAIGVLAYGNRAHIGGLALGLAVGALLLVVVRAGASVRENLELLAATRVDALTDALTGLHNRRALLEDLSAALAVAKDLPSLLVIFDLNGFKRYNDTFGHPAGDALLQRLGHRLAAHVAGRGLAYRLGGDEFCILMRLPGADPQAIAAEASTALYEEGDGFTIGACFGAALITPDMADVTEPLRVADQRLYASKRSAPQLSALDGGVARLARRVGERLGLGGVDLEDLRRAAELHDIGTAAIPQEILAKRGPLDADERAFVEQHSAIGERILAAAPTLRPVSRIVRAAHERYDGAGYPDGLAGEQIPLAARIIAACDAYDALLAGRPYHPSVPAAEAIAELRRCAGAQFDAGVIEALVDVVETPSGPATLAGASRQMP